MKGKGKQLALFEKKELTPEAERLLANWEVVAGAPGGVKRLRELILEMAVRGKLVSQPPEDTPIASVERGCDGPYELPRGWQWARFADVATIESCLVDPAKFSSMPHVAPDNIEKGTGRLLSYRTIAEDGVTSSKHRFFAGQLLYSKIRPNLSKVVLIDFDGLCSADMYPLAAKLLDPRYLLRFMLSSVFLGQVVKDDNRIAMPKVNQQQLSETLVPVPPAEEQKRIVTKVDELMKLCDELEARQVKQRETAARLNKAALDALTSAEGPEELAASWGRLAANFENISAATDSIQALRATILELAAHGTLVRQDPKEGTGAELLAQISKERSQSARMVRSAPSVNDDVAPFIIPESWCWTQWGMLALFTEPSVPTSSETAFLPKLV